MSLARQKQVTVIQYIFGLAPRAVRAQLIASIEMRLIKEISNDSLSPEAKLFLAFMLLPVNDLLLTHVVRPITRNEHPFKEVTKRGVAAEAVGLVVSGAIAAGICWDHDGIAEHEWLEFHERSTPGAKFASGFLPGLGAGALKSIVSFAVRNYKNSDDQQFEAKQDAPFQASVLDVNDRELVSIQKQFAEFFTNFTTAFATKELLREILIQADCITAATSPFFAPLVISATYMIGNGVDYVVSTPSPLVSLVTEAETKSVKSEVRNPHYDSLLHSHSVLSPLRSQMNSPSRPITDEEAALNLEFGNYEHVVGGSHVVGEFKDPESQPVDFVPQSLPPSTTQKIKAAFKTATTKLIVEAVPAAVVAVGNYVLTENTDAVKSVTEADRNTDLHDSSAFGLRGVADFVRTGITMIPAAVLAWRFFKSPAAQEVRIQQVMKSRNYPAAVDAPSTPTIGAPSVQYRQLKS